VRTLRALFTHHVNTSIQGAMDIARYIGPGLLVTVGFIDPGNWASNLAAGADYGYTLLWMVTLSTIMLIILQHNVAHLGIATGECLAEATHRHLPFWASKSILGSALIASVSTALAEILGGAIALNLLFHVPLRLGAIAVTGFVLWMLFSNSYRKLERGIIGFVSIIGIAFVYELSLVHVDWPQALTSWVTVSIPAGSMPIVMAVLGAVVMPHNLFLHSEIIQSRQWNKEDAAVISRQLRFEFMDTLFSMGVGWAINSAMIILAAATFFAQHTPVTDLTQAAQLLTPLLGKGAEIVFGVALLLAGLASTITAGMAGGTIVAGMVGEPYDLKDPHTKLGVIAILGAATVVIFMIDNPFRGLVYSQMLLSMQLPITIGLQIYLTSSHKVMGHWKNSKLTVGVLVAIGVIVTLLNVMLLVSLMP
jgi:manganese transport protein